MSSRDLLACRLRVVAVIAAISGACGGKVIFDTAAGASAASGAGGASSTGQNPSTTTGQGASTVSVSVSGPTTGGATTGTGCNPTIQPGQSDLAICFVVTAGVTCPTTSDPNLPAELTAVAHSGAGGCAPPITVVSVACGPEFPVGQDGGICCYIAVVAPSCIEG